MRPRLISHTRTALILSRSDEFIAALQTYPGSTIDETSLLAGALVFPSNMSTADLPALEIGLGDLLFNITADQYVSRL